MCDQVVIFSDFTAIQNIKTRPWILLSFQTCLRKRQSPRNRPTRSLSPKKTLVGGKGEAERLGNKERTRQSELSRNQRGGEKEKI